MSREDVTWMWLVSRFSSFKFKCDRRSGYPAHVVLYCHFRLTSTSHWATGENQVMLCHQKFFKGWKIEMAMVWTAAAAKSLISRLIGLGGCNNLAGMVGKCVWGCLHCVVMLLCHCRDFTPVLSRGTRRQADFLRSVRAGAESCQQMCSWSNWSNSDGTCIKVTVHKNVYYPQIIHRINTFH